MLGRLIRSLIAATGAMLVAHAPASAQEFRLLMIEQAGCYVCAAFNRDVAPAYEASPEARVAPLVHVDLRGPLPEGVTLTTRPFVTPTFILIGPDGAELERLIGFPGEDFFFPYVNEMFDRARANLSG
ncbi:MAG: hypothetical protein Kow0013_04140 [Pararhodobacter sp.]